MRAKLTEIKEELRRRMLRENDKRPQEGPAPPLAWPVVHFLCAASTLEETDACFTVRDANGQALAYVYSEEPASGPFDLDDQFRALGDDFVVLQAFDLAENLPSRPISRRTGLASVM